MPERLRRITKPKALGGKPRPTPFFFALWPDDTVRGALCERARAVMPERVRVVSCANLHLTLAYLGVVADSQRATAEAIGDAVAAPSFLFTVDAAEAWRRKGIAWIGCRTAPAALATIVEQLRAAMRNAGIRPDDRPFAAHITIARNARSPLRAATIEPLDWPVREFALMRSVAVPGGVRYEPLRVWTLDGVSFQYPDSRPHP